MSHVTTKLVQYDELNEEHRKVAELNRVVIDHLNTGDYSVSAGITAICTVLAQIMICTGAVPDQHEARKWANKMADLVVLNFGVLTAESNGEHTTIQ